MTAEECARLVNLPHNKLLRKYMMLKQENERLKRRLEDAELKELHLLSELVELQE